MNTRHPTSELIEAWSLPCLVCVNVCALVCLMHTHIRTVSCVCTGDCPAAMNVSLNPVLSTQKGECYSDSTILCIAGVFLTCHQSVAHGIRVLAAASGSILLQTMINNRLNHLCQKNRLHPGCRAKATPHGQECKDLTNQHLMWSES